MKYLIENTVINSEHIVMAEYDAARSGIDALIAIREHATNRRDEQVDWKAVDLIDMQLCNVPPGLDNRVDLLLGRPAELPERSEYQLRPETDTAAATERVAELAQAKMSEFEAHMRMLCADTDIEAPDYPGMWK